MSGSIEEFKFREKIRHSYFKHCGDVRAVARETGLDLQFVRKYVKKLHKGEDWKNTVIIARNMQNLILGKYNMRFVRYKEMIDKLESKLTQFLSGCCNKPIQRVGSSNQFVCVGCGETCRTYEADMMRIYDMITNIMDKMAVDDERLSEFLFKMGITEREEPLPPTIIKNTQNIVVMSDGSKKPLPDAYKQKLLEVSKMGPMERERLIRNLEDEILKLDEEIENEGQTTEKKSGSEDRKETIEDVKSVEKPTIDERDDDSVEPFEGLSPT